MAWPLVRRRGVVSGLILWGILVSGRSEARQFPGDPPPGDAQILARGPIHEAFAGPILANPTPGVLAPKPPPSTVIEEIPPSQRPQGSNLEWIPGYWSWDDERGDYVWVSGIWREIPPGRQWVPGYWSQTGNGFLWTSGFWAPAAANGTFTYLPAPPPSLENGPNVPQPAWDYAWVPGSWVWVQDRYGWQPGYWVQANPNWVWVPSSFVATPSGYVQVEGYWDYNLPRRGICFAPVAFGPSTFIAASFSYTPANVLPSAGLMTCLFIRPNYGHYYFGDYYEASRGPNPGYVPWFGIEQRRIGYDPLYASMSALNSRRPEWDRQIRTEYVERVENRQLRPAPTFEGQRRQAEEFRARGQEPRNLALIQPLSHFANHPEATHRFEPVARDHQEILGRRQAEVETLRQDRARIEAQGRYPANLRAEEHRPQRLEYPRSAAIEPRRAPETRSAPPAHPEANQSFRPTFAHEPAAVRPNVNLPHTEPRRNEPHHENRPPAAPVKPHNEPRTAQRAEDHHKPERRR